MTLGRWSPPWRDDAHPDCRDLAGSWIAAAVSTGSRVPEAKLDAPGAGDGAEARVAGGGVFRPTDGRSSRLGLLQATADAVLQGGGPLPGHRCTWDLTMILGDTNGPRRRPRI
ncbi:hypothetical protein GCM10010977_29760 [Citricoccus zhacaiensis]|uniref:Uncharacterized protein n=1 Tax=Citricoccus zhacaiensis TaxID=489142 RepID=A0ABQ2MBA0_9MICC|nr:hypothetical protein GCM10010977_29760 [Citricoccus zhacaiensis]